MRIKNRTLLYFVCFILWMCVPLRATQSMNLVQDTVKQSRVYLEHANILSFNKEQNPDAQVLNGDVRFRHDSTYMYCDSAYFYELTNSLEAFSNVRMEQGDTLFVYGSYLFYDGNTQIANLRENVRMENGEVTLFTDSLNYDRVADIGYYFDGGMIVDDENELTSYYGQYSPSTKLAIFNDSVRVENAQFILYSDTLHYNTENKVVDIIGPSIIESDSGTIYTSKGWYDTANEVALLLDQSQVVSGDKFLIGDSILYNQAEGFSEVFGNMNLRDTAQHIILEGQYGFFNDKTEYAYATDSARFLEYGQGDTLYMHAEKFEMLTVDSTAREVKAYYGVRFFRTDMQGVCDSMQFNTADSVLQMFEDPILWNDEYQMFGDTIFVYLNDSTIDFAHIKQFAFAVQELDSLSYNQLKGNDLKAYFEGKSVRQIDIEGNAESIYYPVEEDGTVIGLNTTKSGFFSIWLNENKLDKLMVWPTPDCLLTPLTQLTPDQRTLKDFSWFDYIRPKDKDDIFKVVKKKVQDTAPRRSNRFVR